MTEVKAQQFTVEPDPGDPGSELSIRKLDLYGIPVTQIAFGNDTNTYLSFRTVVGGTMTEHMVIDANGNLGIGIASAGEKLEVSGTVKATAFNGDGLNLTNLDGSQIATGTIADTRLPLSISRTADVDARFDPLTGHKHAGAAGDGSQIAHSMLTDITGADPGSTDAQTNKHVSNAQTKVWQDHAGIISGNPHGTTAAQVGAPVSVEGITNAGGDIDLVNSNSITIAGNNTTKQITIGETHSARADNPHATTADQIDNQGGTNKITTQINASTGTINEARIDAAIARNSEVSAKFDITSGHDHDGVDSKKIPALSSTYFSSLDGAGLTNLNGSQITTGTVAAARIDTAIVRTSALAVPNGVATLDASTLVVQNPANATATPAASKIPVADVSGKLAAGWGGNASSLATLDANTRLIQSANTVWDGTAGRSASPTPAPNTMPVRDANKDMGDRNGIVLWGLAGENGVTGSTASVSLPVMSVKNGDRILLNIACNTGGIGTTSGNAELTWSGASGRVFNDLPSGSATWASSGVGSGLIWNASTMTVFKVMSDGTLTITNTVHNVGSGSPSYSNRVYAIFLKKQ